MYGLRFQLHITVRKQIEKNNSFLWQKQTLSFTESMVFTIKRAIGVPGFYYFDSESYGFEEDNKKLFDSLSLHTKFQIFLEVVSYEYLSHIFIFRWILNLIRLIFMLLDVYPIFAYLRFGKKYALVSVKLSK